MKTIKSKNPHQLHEVFFILLLVISSLGFGQNSQNSTYDAQHIKNIVVNGNQIFTITIKTTNADVIKVASANDGEYQNDYKVISEIKGNTLFLALKRTTLDITPDDKRNAHKVIAATLYINAPQNISITINSDVGSAKLEGVFDAINIELLQGTCNVYGTAKEASINTMDGNIYVSTSNALIEANSHSGLVDVPNAMYGINIWKLHTISGNITVKNIE